MEKKKIPKGSETKIKGYISMSNKSYDKGDYAHAIHCMKKSIDEVLLYMPEAGNPLIADLHYHIGICHLMSDGFDAAFRSFVKAYSICERVVENSHPDKTRIYRDIARVGNAYTQQERYEEAEKCYLKALEICESEKYTGPEESDVHISLGDLYSSSGRHEAAGEHYRYVLAKDETLSSSKDTVLCNYGLAMVSWGTGDAGNALHYLKKAVKLDNDFIPPFALDLLVAIFTSGLTLGEASAENSDRLFLETMLDRLENEQKAIPANSDKLLYYQKIRGSASFLLGKNEDALKHYYDALKTADKLGAKTKTAASVIHESIADTYFVMGQFQKAIEHAAHALREHEAEPDPDYRVLAQAYDFHMNVYRIALKDYDNAAYYAKKLISVLPMIYVEAMKNVNERIRTHLPRVLQNHINAIHAVACKKPGLIPDYMTYSLLLKSKDVLAEAELVIKGYNPECNPMFSEQLKSLYDKRALLQHMRENNIKGIDEISREIQELEDLVAPHIRGIDFTRHMSGITAEHVMSNIPRESALLEYGWFNSHSTEITDDEKAKSGGRYYAYLLCDNEITLRYLDTDDKINEAVDVLRNGIIAQSADLGAAAHTLYRQLIQPFAKQLTGIKQLYIAPDGDLFKLPFELLTDEQGISMSGRLLISYVSSGRHFARPDRWKRTGTDYKDAAIFADPLYDIPEDGALPPDETADDNKPKQSRDAGSMKRFEPLAYARAEADALDRVFNGEKITRYQQNAGKYAFRDIPSCSIIHVVTHGFALEKQDAEVPDDRFEDPLVRAGLVFSGVNNWLSSDRKKHLPYYGDGMLNAKEVLQMDLWQTDLLVLSACQTGLGVARNGEGIQGLRRAFELAGAGSLICTLWSVDDAASAVLMEMFYHYLLAEKKCKLEALTEARMYVKNMTNRDIADFCRRIGDNAIADCIMDDADALDDTPFETPYFWAGFILQGDIE